MNKADTDRIYQRCSLIAVEQNRRRFLELVQELNRILTAENGRLQDNHLDGTKRD
jgi:hypothetical protein